MRFKVGEMVRVNSPSRLVFLRPTQGRLAKIKSINDYKTVWGGSGQYYSLQFIDPSLDELGIAYYDDDLEPGFNGIERARKIICSK